MRALVLQVLYSIRSERLLVEQLDYNLLFRWFVGLSVDEAVWDHSSFTKNRDRLIEAGVARKLLRRVGARARREGLLSSEHFSVDGTLIEAWSAVKSMRRRDGKDEPPPPGRNPHVDFHGERRSNETHVAPHEPQAKLFRKGKGQPTKLYYIGACADGAPARAAGGRGDHGGDGFAERAAALRLLKRHAGAAAHAWRAIRPTTRASLWLAAASWASPRMWRRTAPVPAARRSMPGPRVRGPIWPVSGIRKRIEESLRLEQGRAATAQDASRGHEKRELHGDADHWLQLAAARG